MFNCLQFRLPKAPRSAPSNRLIDNSGIHVLPDDVLQELFEWIVRDASPAYSVINSPTITPMQLTLGSVCLRWRVVIESISYLWNRITLDCAYFGRFQLPYRRLYNFLSRSRGLPISLCLTSVDNDRVYLSQMLEKAHGQVLDTITPYRRQWKDITLVLDHELVEKKFRIVNPVTLENLECLNIDFRTRYWFDEDPHHVPAQLLSSIIRFPSIKHLDFRTCSPWSYIPKQPEAEHWEKFLHLSIHVSYGLPHLVGLKVMQYLTSAKYIRMNLYVHRPTADGMTREFVNAARYMRTSLPEQIVLPQLRELVLSVDHEVETNDRVLERLVAPNMEALSLSLHPVSEYDGKVLLREAREMASRSPRLKSVYLLLCGSQYIEGEEVTDFIMGCYRQKVAKIEIAGDGVYVLPELARWVAKDSSLAPVVSFVATRGVSKFQYFR